MGLVQAMLPVEAEQKAAAIDAYHQLVATAAAGEVTPIDPAYNTIEVAAKSTSDFDANVNWRGKCEQVAALYEDLPERRTKSDSDPYDH